MGTKIKNILIRDMDEQQQQRIEYAMAITGEKQATKAIFALIREYVKLKYDYETLRQCNAVDRANLNKFRTVTRDLKSSFESLMESC